MPGESGISVLKKVREYQKKIPVVIYSGFVTPELVVLSKLTIAEGK